MDKLEYNEKTLLDALSRSGYLLESEIAKYLSARDYDVDTNHMIKDPFTGKGREIDLTAERRSFKNIYNNKCWAQIQLVFEIKNNSAPIVLLTEYEWSTNFDNSEILKEFKTIPTSLNQMYLHDPFWADIVTYNTKTIYTQYCSFQQKNKGGELMALHPDNIHSGLSKIVQYCDEAMKSECDQDDYLRHFLYLPVLLIQDDLFELAVGNDEPSLKKVESSALLYNYHNDGKRCAAFVYVVTKKGFPKFLESMEKLEETAQKNLLDWRIKASHNLGY